MKECLLLRYGEIGLKSKRKKKYFEKLYREGIEEALRGYEYSIENLGGRFVVYTSHDAVSNLKNVPGIISISPAYCIEFKEKREIIEFSKRYDVKGKTFGVRVKRIGNHNFRSNDLEKEIADVVYNGSRGVNLKNPDVWINVEIRDNKAFFFSEKIKGMGGLPPKSAGSALMLFSGGIDSPVASYLMLKRGCKLDFVYFRFKEKFEDVGRVYNYIAENFCYLYKPRLFVVDARKILEEINKIKGKYRQIALKIAFYKISEKIADENGHMAIVTGEALSQKSTQTLHSLKVIEHGIKIPVLRPLIGMDKDEIVRIARDIGSMELSENVEELCNIYNGPVSTRPSLEILDIMPDFSDYEIEVIEGIYRIRDIPDDVVIVNIMDKDIIGEAKWVPFDEALKMNFEKGKKYLFVCKAGVKSSMIAEAVKNKGIDAYSLSYGEYKRWKESRR